MTRNRVAIITGAGGGIGRATSARLARRGGWDLVLVGRTRATLEQTASSVNTESLVVVADVSNSAEVEAAVGVALKKFGQIDALVNNAGVAPVLSVEQTSDDDWHRTIETNLSAAFYMCRAVWPAFRKAGGGVVVNISSMSARDPFDGFVAYGAAKAGLNTLGLSLAREGAAIGVRVHTIAPGAVETPMFRAIVSAEQFPSERTLSPDDVARVVARCVCGDELTHTSGSIIWLARQP